MHSFNHQYLYIMKFMSCCHHVLKHEIHFFFGGDMWAPWWTHGSLYQLHGLVLSTKNGHEMGHSTILHLSKFNFLSKKKRF